MRKRDSRWLTAVLVMAIAAVRAGRAADRATISLEFLPDGRCTVSADGPKFHSTMTYTPPASAIATGDFRCAVPPVPSGTPVDLVVMLAPGARPWGSGAPPLGWTKRSGRWIGTASIVSAPEVVVVADYSGAQAVRARRQRRASVGAGVCGIIAIVLLANRRRRSKRFPSARV